MASFMTEACEVTSNAHNDIEKNDAYQYYWKQDY